MQNKKKRSALSPFCIIKYSLKNILFVKRNYLQPALLLTLTFLLRHASSALLVLPPPLPYAPTQNVTNNPSFASRNNKYSHCVVDSDDIFKKFRSPFAYRRIIGILCTRERWILYNIGLQRPLTSVCCVNDCKCFNFIVLNNIITMKYPRAITASALFAI